MPIPREIFPDVGPRLASFVWPRALAWTGLVGLFVALGLFGASLERRRVALAEVRASYAKDLAYRSWAADRGGVYVPMDGKTVPNEHLGHLADRDLTTTGGEAADPGEPGLHDPHGL